MTGSVLENLAQEQRQALGEIGAAPDEASLERLRIAWLGQNGVAAQWMNHLRSIADPTEKRTFGQAVNVAKAAMEAALVERRGALRELYYTNVATTEASDPTVPGIRGRLRQGSRHPLYAMQRELERIFTGLGYGILDGPEVEDDFHNFTALNIPADHPARDMQDTFFTLNGHLLRTHTSTMQVRGMVEYGLKPPFRVIAPGRVFRNEATDASHEATFHQCEGMMVDRHVSVAHLIHSMKTLLSEVFGRTVEVRLRPGFFPFVEPGFELDMRCLVCGGPGCAVCKHSGWVEILPCGLVHPQVLRAGGIDPDQWQGFAFGLGLSRLVMMKHKIDDIRHLLSGDARFTRALGR